MTCSSWIQGSKFGELTDGGEDAGEAEVVDGVEGQQVEEELLLLLLTAQEGVALVQLPGTQTHIQWNNVKESSTQMVANFSQCI